MTIGKADESYFVALGAYTSGGQLNEAKVTVWFSIRPWFLQIAVWQAHWLESDASCVMFLRRKPEFVSITWSNDGIDRIVSCSD